MPEAADLEAIAKAADGNVNGVSILAPGSISAGPFVVVRGDGLTVRLDTATGAEPLQVARNAIANADLSPAAALARAVLRLHPQADGAFTAQTEGAMRDRAIVLTAIDEINILRDWITQFKIAVAGAATLAALKTAVANLPNLPQRTAQQAKTAITNKINSGGAD